MEFKDYYKVLSVERGATAEEIKKSYRKLAAKYHPDRHRGDKHFEEKFKELNEAYDVLGDAEKRKQYDLLGANWKQGQQFNPDDFANVFGGGGRGRGGRGGGPRMQTTGGGQTFTFDGGQGGGFSDFFEALFGGAAGARGGAGGGTKFESDPFAQIRGGAGRGAAAQPEADHVETELSIGLEDAFRGTTRRVAFQRTDGKAEGRQDYDVKIPPGIREGQKIRLKGQGGGSERGGYGDILITIHIAADARYALEGSDLVLDLPLAAWEAALGGRAEVNTLEGPLEVKVPMGIRPGQRLRVRGRGWPKKSGAMALQGERGDLLLKVSIHVPAKMSPQETELFEKLKVVSKFNPRA